MPKTQSSNKKTFEAMTTWPLYLYNSHLVFAKTWPSPQDVRGNDSMITIFIQQPPDLSQDNGLLKKTFEAMTTWSLFVYNSHLTFPKTRSSPQDVRDMTAWSLYLYNSHLIFPKMTRRRSRQWQHDHYFYTKAALDHAQDTRRHP